MSNVAKNGFIIVAIFLLSYQTSIITSNTAYATDTVSISIEEVVDSYNESLSFIIDTFLQNIEYDDKGGLKWNKYPNLQDESRSKYYFGSFFGAAGIGSIFLELYSSYLNLSYLKIATQAADYIYLNGNQNGKVYDKNFDKIGYIYWNRSDDSGSVYSGVKYGIAGIANYFLDLFRITNNDTYLQWAEQGLETLMYRVTDHNGLDDGLEGYSWGYGLFSKTPITDIQYGVAGISSTFIKAYQLNLNITYLNFASQGLKWILTQSGIDKNTTDGQRFIRFSPDPFYPFLFSGFLTGNSGIGKILLDYYNITKNEDFLVFAIQIGNWLVATETNGLWDYGGADLLTGTSNEEGSFLGFGAGSSGIGIFLLELFEYTNDVKYLKSVKGIENILEQEAIIEENFRYWNIQASGNFEDIVSTDIKLGISGIGLFYSKLYNFFGLNSSLNILHEIDNYFKSLIIKFNYLPAIVDINADVLNNDLSFLDGLAGVATFYLDVIKSLKSTPKYDKTIYFSLDLNNNSLLFGFIFFTLVSLIIIIKIFYNRKLLK